MAHAAAPRSENILKQGYLKRSLSCPDFLMSASKQLAISLKQKFEPHRWYVFGTRNGQPYLEYYDREERVFTGHPIDTIDLSTFRNLSYTLGRTNHKHSFCIFLLNRVLELTAPNRPQMLDWCRCLERNLRQLGFKNQSQREDHHYSEFPVKNYKPKRSASPSDDQLLLGQQQSADQSGSEAAENPYEDVNVTGTKTSDAGAGAPRLPPRPPKPHKEQEEEVFASLDSVTRNSNSSDGVYYMFDCSEEDQRIMEAHVTASELQVEPDVSNSDLADYDDADGVLVACKSLEERDDDISDHDDEAGERCSSLPILPPKPSESDTSEDADFVSASFWLRNRKEGQNLMSFEDSDIKRVKKAAGRELPPIPNSGGVGLPPPPLPVRTDSEMAGKEFRSRHCFSMYAEVNQNKNAAQQKIVDIRKMDGIAPPLPKRLDIEDIKKLEEKDAHNLKTEHSHKETDTKISLGKRFDSLHVCLDPVKDNVDLDSGTYETVRSPIKEQNNNSIHLMKHNAVENSIYGQVWGTETSKTNPKVELCNESECVKKSHFKDRVALPVEKSSAKGNIRENSDNSPKEHENFYSDFPFKAESEKSGACGFESSDSMWTPNSQLVSKSSGPSSPVLPKRKFPHKSNSSSDLNQIYSEVNDCQNLKESQTDHDPLLRSSEDMPVPPPRRNRKTVVGISNELQKQRNVKSDPEVKSSSNVAGLHSPPLPVRSHNISARKMSEDVIDIPLPLPPRKTTVRTQSVDDSRSPALRPRSHISVRQKSVPQLGVVTVMNLKQTQVDILRSEIASVGGMVRTVSTEHFKNGLALVECFDKIWIAGWDVKKYPRLYDKFHIGDQVLSVNDVQVSDIAFTNKIVKHIKADYVELTIRRLPNASVFAIQRNVEGENLGIKREGGTGEIVYIDPHGLAYQYGLRNKAASMDTNTIVYIDPHGLAYQYGLRNKAASMDTNTVCNWYLTEINNRPLNLFFKDTEIQHRLLAVGRDISIVVQPCDFIQELKKQLKKLRSYKDYLVQ